MTKGERTATARFVVGIDLGTTNTVVAFADTRAAPVARPHKVPATSADEEDEPPPPRPRIEVLPVPQLISPGEVEARPQLPSFRYHPAPGELAEGDLELGLPLEDELHSPGGDSRAVTGVLAQQLGGRVPGRLVASAKSWLCHAGVDREAAILPWGAADDVPKVSPVEASASYLAHVRAAWDAAHPEHPLSAQQVVLTVPASFDEAARALTLKAAQHAGLPGLRLIEEPQAAFYDWLDRHVDTLQDALAGVRLALVLDAGGGTTDLTLIRAELAPSGPKLTRIAVGDHLLLGGDNMDHALSHLCEPALSSAGKRLPAGRFAQLLQQCREAKQRLLATDAPDEVAVTLLGSGSKLVGGRVSTQLSRAQVEHALVDGFFAAVSIDDRPAARRGGLVEFGLPFAADPVITRHVAGFLARHRSVAAEALDLPPAEVEREPARALPDAVLFNGGVFKSELIAQRMLEVLGGLRGTPLTQLDNPDPDLAVARGAVAYGLARRGIGLKIGGGSPRSYYLRVTSEEREHDGVCVLPRGAEEGEEHALTEGTFALKVGRPVRFGLFTHTSERARAGDLVTLDDSYNALPDLCAVIEGVADDGEELEVELHAQLTEIGTLEMSLVSTDGARRYRLEFQLRGESPDGAPSASAQAQRVGQLHPRFREARELIELFYGKAQKSLQGRKINTLRMELEKTLGERSRWDTAVLRELFAALLAGQKRRRRSAEHERVWFGLMGYSLRPGFGYPLDDWRVSQLWPLYEQGVQFNPEAAVWAQFWILWRRIAGGLDQAQQERILDDLVFYLDPEARKRARPKGPRKQGLEEMVRLAGSLERLPAARKVQLGGWLLQRAGKDLSHASAYWSVGRLGARAPFYGSAHTVVPPEVAGQWLERLLALDLAAVDQATFAVSQLARTTHDRARDLSLEQRERAASALSALGASEAWIRGIREGGELDTREVTQVFGESLPAGLRLL